MDPQRMILNPAVQTAKNAKYANGKGVAAIRAFSQWVDRASSPIRSVFACFACFAVPTAFSRMILRLGIVFSLLAAAGTGLASELKRKDTVVFFPTLGRQIQSGWELDVH